MAKDLTNATANIAADTITRNGREVRSGILAYNKTGTGTATLSVKNGANSLKLSDDVEVSIPATDPSGGNVEFPLSEQFYIELESVSGSVSVTAEVDGAGD